jgi:hypothetical protein
MILPQYKLTNYEDDSILDVYEFKFYEMSFNVESKIIINAIMNGTLFYRNH